MALRGKNESEIHAPTSAEATAYISSVRLNEASSCRGVASTNGAASCSQVTNMSCASEPEQI